MKHEIEIPDEWVAKAKAEGCEISEWRAPKKGERGMNCSTGTLFTAAVDWLDEWAFILRKLPAQPWAPGVGKHKTRGGGEAEVKFIMDDGRRVGTHTERNGSKSLMAWDAEGRYATRGIHCCDLMPPAPVPPQPEAVSEPLLEGWVNVYRNGWGAFHSEQANAATNDTGSRLRCVHVREVREGVAE